MAAGAATIVLEVHDAESAARCLRTVPRDAVVLAGGAEVPELEQLAAGHELRWIGGQGGALWNAAAELTAGDLLLLDGRSELGEGALGAFEAAAAAVGQAAAVTALSNAAGYLSVPHRNSQWPLPAGGATVADSARQVTEASLSLYPRIPVALPHATLVRRPALDLIGSFDAQLGARDALADFSVRAIAAGLVCICADNIFVGHRGGQDGEDPADWSGPSAERHPLLADAVRDAAWDRGSALSRALLSVSVALEPLSVTVDARGLAGPVSGSSIHLAELLGALSSLPDLKVRALVPSALDPQVQRMLPPEARVERLGLELPDPVARTHVAHRPTQVETFADVELLDRLGERTVVTHQDLIGYRTPAAFGETQDWLDHRSLTRDALGCASRVVFFTQTALDDALADDLVVPERACVVGLGMEPSVSAAQEPTRPPGLSDTGDRPYLVQIGRRFKHKNTGFSLRLLSELRSAGWDGDLVIAGPEVLHGSGTAADAAWLLAEPDLEPHVHELGAVTEAEKSWLLEHAAAVLYPSTYEGFGLVPFEAAAAGRPVLAAPVSAIAETLPEGCAVLVPWDAQASAAAALALLEDGPRRTAHVAALREAAGARSWQETGAQLAAVYREAVRATVPVPARLLADAAAIWARYGQLRGAVDSFGWQLVDPDGPLVDHELAEQLVSHLRGEGGSELLKRRLALGPRGVKAAELLRRATGS